MPTTGETPYTGNGSTTIYALGFEYSSRDFVKVYVGGSLKVITTDYVWHSDTEIRFNVAPANGALIVFKRVTDADVLKVNIANAVVLDGETIQKGITQALHAAVEVRGDVANILKQDLDGKLNATSRVIKNLASGVNVNDAVTVGQVQAITGIDVGAGGAIVADLITLQGNLATTNTTLTATTNKVDTLRQAGGSAWSSATAYVVGNVVLHSNEMWMCLINNTNSAPTTVNANWTRISTKVITDALSGRLDAVEALTVPNGFIYAPLPTFDTASPRRVNFNGALTARSRDNTVNIVLSSASRNLDLATNGANGLADGLTVANNTWYYVYAYSGGYVASTTNNATTLTIASVSQKVVQLPLALRTNSSANIINFIVSEWNMRSSKINYHKAWKRAITGISDPSWNSSIQTGQTDNRVGSNVNIYNATITNYTTFDLSSLVPAGSVSADIYVYVVSAGGAGNLWFAMRGVTSQTGIDSQRYTAVSSARAFDQSLELPIDTNRQFQAVTDGANMNIDVSVTGYQFQV
jgi:hypothetical protein